MDLIITDTINYFRNLEPLLLVFWCIGLFASLIFFIQAILSMIGLDGTGDVDADFDGNLDGHGSSFQWLSLRNMVNFLLGFGWSGVVLYRSISNVSLLILVSLLVGISFVLLFVMVMRQFKNLEENNTFNIHHTLNKTAQVYLTIPAMKKGKGKILISVNGTTRELEALSESEAIETGAMVRVTRIIDNSLLSVEKI